MALLEYERWYIAHDGMMFLTFWPCLIIFLISLCASGRRNDPARSAFSYLKVALALFTLFIFLDFCGYGLALAAARLLNDRYVNSYYSDSAELIRNIQFAQTETFTVARLIECLTDIVVFIMLVQIGIGIILAHSIKPYSLGKGLRFSAFAISAVLVALTLAQFGLRTHFFSIVYAKYGSSAYSVTRDLANQYNNSRQIDFAFKVLLFVLALGIVAQSIMVKMQTKTNEQVSTASNTFIACAGLWLLRNVYAVASTAASTNLKNFYDDPDYHNYYDALDVIFGVWPQFILLCLVYGLGRKKQNGLWSTEQPYINNHGPGMTPWGYNYQPEQVMDPNAVHQQQQQLPVQQQWPQYPQQQSYAPYYPPAGQDKSPIQQQQAVPQPQFAPQTQHQMPIQPYTPQSPVSNNTRSPPPHEDAMGLHHQADGTPPQVSPQPYYEKA